MGGRGLRERLNDVDFVGVCGNVGGEMVNAKHVDGWYDQAKKQYENDPPMWTGLILWLVLITVGVLLIG